MAGESAATTHYVSPTSSDANDVLTVEKPWRTVARVNAATVSAGDTVLMEGGASLQAGSPLIGRGLALGSAPYALSVVAHDFFGDTVPGHTGASYNLGADGASP